MPIQVTCPGCKTLLKVSEKFAGKQGPCPKCKALISIPKLTPEQAAAAAAPPKPQAEVKIHGPETPAQPGKTSTGAKSIKPLTRTDARLTPKLLIVTLIAVVGIFAAAKFGGNFVRGPAALSQVEAGDAERVAERRSQLVVPYLFRVLGLLLVGWPIVLAGYAVLRDDELDPYRGRALLTRTASCLAVYLLVWAGYVWIPDDMKREAIAWVFFAPLMIIPATVAAYFAYELDPVGSAIHACFFLLVTLALGWTAGLDMPWTDPNGSPIVPFGPDQNLEIIYK